MVIPLFVGREKSVRAVEAAYNLDKKIMLAVQKEARSNDPFPDEIFKIGTIAEIVQIVKLSDGTIKILVEGKKRAKVTAFLDNPDFLEAACAEIEDIRGGSPETVALMRAALSAFEKFLKLSQRVPPETLLALADINDPGHFADLIASHLSVKIEDKQLLLETPDPRQRIEKVFAMLNSELEILDLEKKVRGRVKDQMEQNQKEYYLNEQLRAIQKELGKGDEKTEIEELREKIQNAGMPVDVNKKALKELRRLEMMQPMSSEATVVRNYIDWLVDLPWKPGAADRLNIKRAGEILDEDHYGLEKIKERILEYLAVRKLSRKMKGPILCFAGPPGVGKTSLGKSIARALGRKFARVSLGGIRDEAEIRGHRRTYIGSMPGKIIQSIKKAGTRNPVLMLDEIDKMGNDFRGDPASALLEVLDPEQNHAFNDHYLEVDYDLSEVVFITTANILYTIPKPLLDRMEVLRLPGYTDFEKVKISEKFLIPRKIEEHGLSKNKITFERSSIEKIIRSYTREAGVRNLEREIAAICRKTAKSVVEKKKRMERTVITGKSVQKLLGPSKFNPDRREEKDETGAATGLAWTEVGGELLATEVVVTDGKGELTLTGKLGDVMKESARAAFTYVRSIAPRLGLSRNFYKNKDIHIHVPEGAIPKDGPSAGITLATALISALAKIPVKHDLAMTGEITLRGKVLPVGGIKEKVLAAHRGRISEVIIPKDNENDLREIPANVRKRIKFHAVSKMDEVLDLAFPGKIKDSPPKEDLKNPGKLPEYDRNQNFPLSIN
ncbi:MAG: endopeptidase La [Nitrospinae bacterium]|nr:endopeptidase La [Nitrospinota bacterium]